MDEKDIEHRLTEIEERSKSNTHRLDKVEERQDNLEELTSTVKVLVVKEENVEKNVEEIKTDIKTLTDKPAKRWDSMIDKAISTLIGGLIGYFLVKLGL